MERSNHARSFLQSGEAYDAFMGRYSSELANAFVDSVGVSPGMSVLDVGCGPGALTQVLSARLGAAMVSAIDPSPPFVAECSKRCPGVRVELGGAEAIPFPADAFDAVLAQLVLHFVADPAQAGHEFHRVVRPGGLAAACVWDFADEMEMLRHFWDAALTVDPRAPDEARVLRFGRQGELAEWLEAAGFRDVVETKLEVASSYADFEELWSGFLRGIGPAGAYCVSLPDDHRAALGRELFSRLGSPDSSFTLRAVARGASGRLLS